jgi:hypothetical protein
MLGPDTALADNLAVGLANTVGNTGGWGRGHNFIGCGRGQRTEVIDREELGREYVGQGRRVCWSLRILTEFGKYGECGENAEQEVRITRMRIVELLHDLGLDKMNVGQAVIELLVVGRSANALINIKTHAFSSGKGTNKVRRKIIGGKLTKLVGFDDVVLGFSYLGGEHG